MSRVITFSRTFPGYHPRKGEPTHFVEKILRSIHDDEHLAQLYQNMEIMRSLNFYEVLELESIGNFDPKHHTIRAGHRWKVGDWFSPRVWSGRPYNSKQITIGPDIEIKRIWNFSITQYKEPYYLGVRLDGRLLFEVHKNEAFLAGKETLERISFNDGLELSDFEDWFEIGSKYKLFHGQIICWNENIEY